MLDKGVYSGQYCSTHADEMMRNTELKYRATSYGSKIVNKITYADDTVLIAESKKEWWTA